MNTRYNKQQIIKDCLDTVNLGEEQSVITTLSPIGRRVLANYILSVLPEDTDTIAEDIINGIFTDLSKDLILNIVNAETNKYIKKYQNGSITEEEQALLAFLLQLKLKVKGNNIEDYKKSIKEYFNNARYTNTTQLAKTIATDNIKGTSILAGIHYFRLSDDSSLLFPTKTETDNN